MRKVLSLVVGGHAAAVRGSPSRGLKDSDDCCRGTASVASDRSYSSSVPSHHIKESLAITASYKTLPETSAERIRIQNLRFAYFLCGAQQLSRRIKN
jgi:hypothetical protein